LAGEPCAQFIEGAGVYFAGLWVAVMVLVIAALAALWRPRWRGTACSSYPGFIHLGIGFGVHLGLVLVLVRWP
jgi:hypothetical protein